MRPRCRPEQAENSLHHKLLTTHGNHVVTQELPAPAILRYSVDQNGSLGQQHLDVRTRFDGIGELEELAEPDPAVPGRHCAHPAIMTYPRWPWQDRFMSEHRSERTSEERSESSDERSREEQCSMSEHRSEANERGAERIQR